MIKYTLLIMSVIGLSGCGSTADVNTNCYQESWQEAGKEVALNGKSVRHFEQIRKQCGTQLPNTAKAEFIQGYTNGLSEYCTYESGYKLGIVNIKKNNICPLESRSRFDDGYQVGNFNYREKMHGMQRARDAQDLEEYSKGMEGKTVHHENQ